MRSWGCDGSQLAAVRDSPAAPPGIVQCVGNLAAPGRDRPTDEVIHVCRNIRPLFNYEPPATEQEIRAAALQYVRKISGSTDPSAANREAFERAVDEVAEASAALLRELVTTAPPRDREVDAARARERAARRFGARSAAPRPEAR